MLTITIKATADNINTFLSGFLERNPVETENGIPIMSEIDWIKIYIIRHLRYEAETGLKQIAANSATLADNIFE